MGPATQTLNKGAEDTIKRNINDNEINNRSIKYVNGNNYNTTKNAIKNMYSTASNPAKNITHAYKVNTDIPTISQNKIEKNSNNSIINNAIIDNIHRRRLKCRHIKFPNLQLVRSSSERGPYGIDEYGLGDTSTAPRFTRGRVSVK